LNFDIKRTFYGKNMQIVVLCAVVTSLIFGARQAFREKYGAQHAESILCVSAICDGVKCVEQHPVLVRLLVVDDVYSGSKRIIVENRQIPCE
jgi:hypothetical protein